jgi:hypothetical protein
MDDEDKRLMYDKIAHNNPRSTPIQAENLETHEIFSFCSIGRAGKWLQDEFGYNVNAKRVIMNSIKRNGIVCGFKWTILTHAS